MSNIIGAFQSVQLFRNFSAQELNPQPLPPKELGKQSFGDPAGAVALNPQPLPPKALTKLFGSLFGSRMLNPQPLPPKALSAVLNQFSNQIDDVALNPQPLPPKPQPDPDPFRFKANLILASRSLAIR